jgi:hypothetical protein
VLKPPDKDRAQPVVSHGTHCQCLRCRALRGAEKALAPAVGEAVQQVKRMRRRRKRRG